MLALHCAALVVLGLWLPPNLPPSEAVVVVPTEQTPLERKAVQVLVEETAKRSGVVMPVTTEWPNDGRHAIVVGTTAQVKAIYKGNLNLPEPPDSPEAYAVDIDRGGHIVVIGHDARGVLYGVGKLLRSLSGFTFAGPYWTFIAQHAASAPAMPLRGHQLGYRPKTNSYDAWTPQMWEQYIRDLAVFGTNAIELIPPRSDDAATSPHFPLSQIEMLKRMSQICDDYGMDVWIWYPALDKDYTDPATMEFALKEWGEVFAQVPRIDHIFVPGGDPGHTPPGPLMDLLEKQTANLHKYYPNAKMWMSPQGFTKEWMDEFLAYMQTKQPTWLEGVVFGPQNRMKLADLRAALPAQYPIRHYPDITHTIMCQFPVPDWDIAYALTLNREPINPRPTQFAHIFNLFAKDTCGFITYSEGCNDDVNKVLWSALGWDPQQTPEQIMNEYARYFIGDVSAVLFGEGLLALEQNWVGPLASNASVPKTLAIFQDLERNATPQVLGNWRFQQALYRAYYDAYVQQRAKHETQLQADALEVLAKVRRLGSERAVAEAVQILDKAKTEPVAQELRARVFELADDLYKSIRMQLSVPLYQAIGIERGANLDLIDNPVNDVTWLKLQFEQIRKMDKEKDRRAALLKIAHWKDPGPGGFYDNFGDPAQQPHLVRSAGYDDPEFKTEPNMGRDWELHFRTAWNQFADTRYEQPLQARYEGLDPKARYTVRAVYAGDSMDRKLALTADDLEVHPMIERINPPGPVEFDVPPAATADGEVTFTWRQEPRGGGGRGCQVAELWLIKKGK